MFISFHETKSGGKAAYSHENEREIRSYCSIIYRKCAIVNREEIFCIVSMIFFIYFYIFCQGIVTVS